MNLQEAIIGRRSIGKVKDEAIPRELIEQIIEAAVWAPNHFRTEPWRFVVMTGEGRRTLGNAYVDIAEAELGELNEEERAARVEREVAKAFRAPVVITVISAPSDDPRAVLEEELAAVHAGVQNLLLTAHSLGLGTVWRTGNVVFHPKMKAAFDVQGKESIVGMIYVGYPDMTPAAAKRTPGTEKTIWLE